tara:strand:- start:59 stop:841 length:783 start_codon:yes stop_codon:yes gene_type:complete
LRLQYAPANQSKNVLKGEKDLNVETMVAVIEMTEVVAETETITDVIIAGMTVEGATGEGRKTMTDMVIMTGFAPSVTTQISHLDKNVTVVENQGALAEAEVMTVANVMTEEVETIVEITAVITSNMETMIGIVRSVTILIFHSVQNVIAVANQEVLAEVEVMTVANVMTEEVETIEEMIVEVVIIVVAVMTEEANEGHVMIDNGLEMTEEWGLEIILRVSLSPNLNPNSKKDLEPKKGQEIIEGIGKKGLVEMIDVLAIE